MPLTAEELNRLCNEVLSAIEVQEARLLNWGFINGAMTLDDLDARLPELGRRLATDSPELAALWAQAQADGLQSREIVRNLVQRCLIFPSGNRYRSRFAETVRALFLLRQRFSAEDWNSGDRLVGDMKLLLQRRRFPKREVTVDDLLAELAPLGLSPLGVTAIRALLQEKGRDLTLARFQVQSTVSVLRDLQSSRESALVIGAGTGAGKTKAFYIPALAAITDRLGADSWVQAIAIYPRTELLKDQLRETYAEARKLDRTLKAAGKRSIRVGAYYGDVPADAADVLRGRRENWRRTRDRSGWICPYVACPTCGQQTMVWSEDDLKLEDEDNRRQRFGRYARLTCQHCHTEVDAATILLTRRQMLAEPPDILFTTTEMLNRRLSNLRERALFGIGVAQPPYLLLMDEIHLNEGIHGAQIAYLLRRWRHLRRRQGNPSLCVVGLSATLTQADQFFARLTGIPAAAVTYIAPADRDLVKEGLEYNVVLKGDPVAGTTLLSTSVRTAMLICRVLDPLKPPGEPTVSAGAYGQRAFAFSDKLDVINRWYHIEREVENPTEPYSRYLLVDRSARDAKLRYDQGQNWYFVPAIHGESDILTSGLRLDLTSSQYGGVDNRANLVVASSTLEVGYNDPSVGAILQHKTPHSRASFIQRKGRAGRTRAMRPWTVLVTSAYGHDRWAFQHAEQLFDPLLPPLDLPLDNYYVRKIQAAFALLDWLADHLALAYPTANVWQLLSSAPSARGEELDRQRQALAGILLSVLRDDTLQASFKQHLVAALALTEDGDYVADTLLWGEPRPLLLEVIPTALRQLENRWQRTTEAPDGVWQVRDWADNTADRPLPDYLPAALFSDLKSPDVIVRIPERQAEGEPFKLRGEEPLGVALALAEYVPGKVNKRFARKERIRESHWLAVPEEAQATQTIDLATLAATYDPTPRRAQLAGAAYDVYCPRTLTLALVPHFVRPTSSARFVWRSQFAPQSLGTATASGLPIDWQPAAPLHAVLNGITVFTHANGSWVGVTRAAPEVRVSTRYEHGGEQRLRANFSAGGQPAALGFGVDVDALRFAYSPLDVAGLRSYPAWPECYRRLAGQFYHHLFATDPVIEQLDLNDLEIDWLWQISLAMFVQTASERQCSPAEAVAALRSSFGASARRALATVFDVAPAASGHASETPFDETTGPIGADDDEQPGGVLAPETNSPAEVAEIGFLHAKLLRHLYTLSIQQVILRHLPVLWQDDHPGLAGWLGSAYAHSLGAALFTTLGELAPEVQADDLHYDIDEAEHTIWVSEAAAGGVGLVARLANQIAQHPRQFELHLRKAIRTCTRRTLASQLNQVADLVLQRNPELSSAFSALRTSADLPRIEETHLALAGALERHGIPATRALSVNLNMKFLRPNSDGDTDLLVAMLAAFWHAEEDRLGVAIDLRAIAVAAAQHPDIQQQLQAVLRRIGSVTGSVTGSLTGGPNDDGAQTYNLLQSMLWLDCHDACPDCIERLQRFQVGPRPSRALLTLLLEQDAGEIDATASDWQAAAIDKLAAGAHCDVLCPHDRLAALAPALAVLTATPIDVESQLLYPVIEGIERHNGNWRVSLVISELAGE